MKFVLQNLVLLLSLFCSICILSALNYDGLTLLLLLGRWKSVPSNISSSWNAYDSSSCLWLGVECDNAHNLFSLNLSGYGISGEIGPEIGHFSRLQTIDLSLNPPELGNCSSLEALEFSGIGFTGGIPSNLKKLKKLQTLSLYESFLSGEVPELLLQIPDLEYVYLNDNNLNGSIPASDGNMNKLLSLFLRGNQLSGEIPSSIGNCRKLQEISVE